MSPSETAWPSSQRISATGPRPRPRRASPSSSTRGSRPCRPPRRVSPTSTSIFHTVPVMWASTFATRPPPRFTTLTAGRRDDNDYADGAWRPRLPISRRCARRSTRTRAPRSTSTASTSASRTREPDWVYEAVRIVTSLYAWTFFRARGDRRRERAEPGPVILAPEPLLVHGPLLRRRVHPPAVRFMAKSQLFKPADAVDLHARRRVPGAARLPRRGGVHHRRQRSSSAAARSSCTARAAARARASSPSEPKRGIGRLALESGAPVVPVAIHGSSQVRNWKRLQFPKVDRPVRRADPLGGDRGADARPAAAGRGRDLRPDPRALRGARRARPQGRRAPAARGAPSGPPRPRHRVSATVLRPELLDGVALLLAAADPPSRFGEAVIARAAELRAAVDRVVVDPTGDEVAPRDTDVVVWDGASLAGPRDVLDGAWLALRPAAGAWIAAERPGLLLLLAPPPGDAGAEAARAGLENLARTLSIEWARHGIRTARDPARRGHRAGGGRRARRLPRLARGRLLLRLRVPAGRRMSWKVTRLDDVEPLPGPGTLRWLPVRHELGIGAFGTNAYMARERRRRRRRAAHRGGHRPRGAVLRRPRRRHVHARRRDRPRARRHLRLPARPDHPPPRHGRRARHHGALVRRLARPRRSRSPAGSRASARARSASRTRRAPASSTRRRSRATRTASGRTTTSPAGTRSTARSRRRAGCSTARSSSAATRSASRRPRIRTWSRSASP